MVTPKDGWGFFSLPLSLKFSKTDVEHGAEDSLLGRKNFLAPICTCKNEFDHVKKITCTVCMDESIELFIFLGCVLLEIDLLKW